MKIAVLSTRNRSYHPNARLLEAAVALGHEAFLLHPKKVLMALCEHRDKGSLPRMEVCMPRIGSTIEDSELSVVYHLQLHGIPAVNDFQALVVSRDKFLSLCRLRAEGLPTPPSVYVTDPSQVHEAIECVGGLPVVLKALRGRQGTDVFLAKDMDLAIYMASHPPGIGGGIIVQRFLPSATEGDYRVLVLGDRVVASMKRIPRTGEFRANIHLRAKGIPWDPPSEWRSLALKATEALGLDIAGVDLLGTPHGPLILEVNTTPGFRELERVTRVDVAKELIEFAVKKAKGGDP